MKKTAIAALLMVFVTGWYSCSKDKGQVIKGKTVVCDSTKVTYMGDVKQIMDDNCSYGSCHDGATQSPDLTTYAAVVSGVSGGTVICRMQASCGAVMPKGGPKLADSLINKVIQWQTGGYCDTISH
jgi:hypothetical protein